MQQRHNKDKIRGANAQAPPLPLKLQFAIPLSTLLHKGYILDTITSRPSDPYGQCSVTLQ